VREHILPCRNELDICNIHFDVVVQKVLFWKYFLCATYKTLHMLYIVGQRNFLLPKTYRKRKISIKSVYSELRNYRTFQATCKC
jgi:hypothetical protein